MMTDRELDAWGDDFMRRLGQAQAADGLDDATMTFAEVWEDARRRHRSWEGAGFTTEQMAWIAVRLCEKFDGLPVLSQRQRVVYLSQRQRRVYAEP